MTAANHFTRWTVEEDAFLQGEWDGTRATAALIAELLERTVNAVAQRHYELEWGTAADPAVTKPLPGESRITHVRVTRTVEVTVVDPADVCDRCWTLRSVTGECAC